MHNQLSSHPDQSPVSREVQHNRVVASQMPSRFLNLRQQRYRGEDFDVSVSTLSPSDQEHIRLLYGFAKGLYLRWNEMRDAPDWVELRRLLSAILAEPLATSAKALGLDTMAQKASAELTLTLGKVLHDLRGGALMPLQLYAHMSEWDPDTEHLRSAAFLARDQAKIMRNILPDLDPELRRADEAEKPHAIKAVVDKWDAFRFERHNQGRGHVNVTCDYDGLLASCCLEASAVDRIVYNYVNNAMRFTSGPAIDLEIIPVGNDAVRWIVANRITTDQADWLDKSTKGDLASLFRGGLTRGGHGLGLSNCADFVAAAFGLPDIQTALDGKYLGACVEDGWYRAWAHWPSLYTQ